MNSNHIDPYSGYREMLVACSSDERNPQLASSAQAALRGEPAMFFVDAWLSILRSHEQELCGALAILREMDSPAIEIRQIEKLRQHINGLAAITELAYDSLSVTYEEAVRTQP